MPSRAVSAIEAAAPSGVVTAAADSGVGPGAGGLAEAYERDDVERDATMPRVGAPFVYDPPTGQLPRRRSRLSPAKAADEGERSEWGGEMTDASCDTDTLEIDSDEDEW